MKNFLSLIIFLNFLNFTKAQVTTPQTYIAYQTYNSLTIDGKADENEWSKVPFTSRFIDIEGDKIPPYSTKVKMLYDQKYFYFYAELEEQHIWANLYQRDTVIFYNNDFEIFIDPTGDTHNYYEFEINALNTVWDLLITKPYREPAPIIDSWDIQGLKSAVQINGTLNDGTDLDKSWSVEIAIPWQVLEEAAATKGVPTEQFWRVNFSRVNWDYELTDGKYNRKKDENGNYLPEYNWVWSPQGVINMHEPEKWGYVYFSPKYAGQNDTFEIPKTEEIKWYLYKLYRDINSKKINLDKLSQNPKDYEMLWEEKTLVPRVEKHWAGYNIIIENPNGKEDFVIQQDGKFLSISK